MEAQVHIIGKERKLEDGCERIPILVLDYDLLEIYENAVVAFFWKKGRPNIVFLKKRLEKFNIVLPESYKIYEEEKIW